MGNNFPMCFAPAVTTKLGFLQRQEAQKTSFSSSKLTDILFLFHIPLDSLEVVNLATTLRLCDMSGNMAGDLCHIAKDLVGHGVEMLGTGHIQALAAVVLNTGVSLQPCTAWVVKPIQGSSWAASSSYTLTVCIDTTYQDKQALHYGYGELVQE